MKVKVTLVLSLLLLATANAGFFSKVGDFFANMAKNFGHSAINHIKDTGISLAKNITSNTANLLAETGQMAMFELGNINHGRRDVSKVANQIQAELHGDVQKLLAVVTRDAETVVTSCRQLLQAMLQGKLGAREVLAFMPRVHDAIRRVAAELQDGMWKRLLHEMSRHDNGHQGAKGVMDDLKTKMTHILGPLTNSLNKELGGVASVLQAVADRLQQGDTEGVVKALMGVA